MKPKLGFRKVVLLEFNEITWSLIDPMIENGCMPNLARMRQEGTWAAPISNDQPPYLDPWITWVTVHSGVDCNVHMARILEQSADTIRSKRSWDYAIDAGRTVGIFGSISSFPPRPVKGFWIPAPFAPSSETFPPELQPIQDLNRKYTQIHNRVGGQESFSDMLRLGLRLLKLGLKPSTATRLAWQLMDEHFRGYISWKRISLQPLVNFDFFSTLYRQFRPDYSTWHTNHVAHYMHHYWRAMDDSQFLVRATREEKRRFGGAVEYGYLVADYLLGKFMKLIDDNTVLVLASSMGQQPYVAERYPAGRITMRVRDIHQILRIVGATALTEVVPVMTPQWNVTIPDTDQRVRVKNALLNAYRTGIDRSVFDVAETKDILRITPRGLAKRENDLRVFFPDGPAANGQGYALDDLFVADDPTPMEGTHHPQGLLVLWGKGIRSGVEIRGTDNVDIAPTILVLLGIPVPSIMKGRVLSEAWEGSPAA